MRESALALAQQKLEEARNEVLAHKARLEAKQPGLLKGLAGKSKEREVGLQTATSNKLHYDSQLKKAESLTALINKETNRWLECCLKTGAPDYAAALATHDYAEDWTRFGYGFELLIKSFQMGLQEIHGQFKRENPDAARSPLLLDSIRKMLPVARQIEIDIEFFNRILTQQARLKGAIAGKAALQPEYSWCETTELLATQSVNEALGMLKELLAACDGFLPAVAKRIKREQGIAEDRAAQSEQRAKDSFLRRWREALRPAAALSVKTERLETIISETEAMLMDGEFSSRFNRYMAQTMTPSTPQPTVAKATTAPAVVAAPQSDAELRALKAQLRAELDETGKLKAELIARERTLRENELAFAEKCRREKGELEAMEAKLNAREEEIALKARQWEETQARELAQLDETKRELETRALYVDESEQRLLAKGQEQIEHLAELEQQEEELMTIKRDLNVMRKELGLPVIPLRAKPVDEFEE